MMPRGERAKAKRNEKVGPPTAGNPVHLLHIRRVHQLRDEISTFPRLTMRNRSHLTNGKRVKYDMIYMYIVYKKEVNQDMKISFSLPDNCVDYISTSV